MSLEIGIIGAGAHGATVAYHLARRGIRPIVFERGAPASGPTGEASGVVRSYYTNPFLAEVASQSTAVLADFAEQVGGGSGYVETGALYLHDAGEAAEVDATSAVLTGAGVEHRRLDHAALASGFPGLAFDSPTIGIWEEHAGYADPRATTVSYAARAVELGAELRLRAEVVSVREHGAGVTVGLSSGETYEVQRLLVAAGPWTAALLAQVGVRVPLTTERHVVAGLTHRASSVDDAIEHVLIDVPGGYYSRPSGLTGEFLVGGLAPAELADPDRFSPELSDDELSALAARVAGRVRVRADTTRSRGWASLYDVSPDWQPAIGQVGERVFVDAGTSGHGFKLSPVLGDHVARLLLGDADPRLQPFHPDRFGGHDEGRLASGFGTARILG
jgi:glycine/D-amino acid oxidase-like deaminating enzyme